MAPTLGYWDLRGLAEPLRTYLLYVGENFTDKRYRFAGPNGNEWAAEKHNLDLEFPNLPYYIDGDVKITESSAILRYIERKYKQEGKTEEQRIRVDMGLGLVNDISRSIITLCYSKDFETAKAPFLANIRTSMDKVSRVIGESDWVCGNKLTVVDFVLPDLVARYELLAPEALKEFPRLEQHRARLYALPAIKRYHATENYKRIADRLNGPGAIGAGTY